jgi:hypothetical protein
MSPEALAVVACHRLHAGDPIGSMQSPVTGCTDSSASNFDAAAVADDDTCRYACPDDGICFIYNVADETWQPTAPDVFDNEPRNVLIQGRMLSSASDSRHCSFDYFDTLASWQQADRACTANGGRLATVSSDIDYGAIKSQLPLQQPVWIGLNDMRREQWCDGTGFVWADGDGPATYQQWTDSEPDSFGCRLVPSTSGGDALLTDVCEAGCSDNDNTCIPIVSTEDCVQMVNRGDIIQSWEDKDCSELKPYICGYRCIADASHRESVRMKFRNSQATLRMLQFDGQIAYGGGGAQLGAALAFFASETKIEHVRITNSIQRGAGAAAIFVEGGFLDISFSQIEKNKLHFPGSAGLQCIRGTAVRLSYSRIEENEVLQTAVDVDDPTSTAAAIMLEDASLECTYSRISFNVGASAIAARNATLSIANSVVKNNKGLVGATLTLVNSVATLSNIIFSDNSGSTGALRAIRTVVTMLQATFVGNRGDAATASGGALYLSDGSSIIGTSCTFKLNSAFASVSAGAILCDRSGIQLTDSKLALNKVEQPQDGGRRQLQTIDAQAVATAGAGAIHAVGSTISIARSEITENSAIDSEGELLVGAFANALYTRKVVGSAFEVNVKESTFQPFVEGHTVQLSPRVVGDVVMGGCQQNPCDPGNKCLYKNYSLSCQPCSPVTHSPDGIACDACPPSTGPNDDLTDCDPCLGNNMSSFGVCMPCEKTLVANEDHTSCADCGAQMTAVTPPWVMHAGLFETPERAKRVCGCMDSSYNSSKTVFACFHGGYDQALVNSESKKQAAAVESGLQCNTCPADVTQESCLVCNNGAAPRVRAGFTIPTLGSQTSRRSLSDGAVDGTELVTVFRCHIELDLAQKRCPENAEPGVCAEGYEGSVCNECVEGYGMSGSTRTCELCDDSGYTGESLLLLLAIVAGTALVLGIIAKVWKAFPLKHLLRCAFQPVSFKQMRPVSCF